MQDGRSQQGPFPTSVSACQTGKGERCSTGSLLSGRCPFRGHGGSDRAAARLIVLRRTNQALFDRPLMARVTKDGGRTLRENLGLLIPKRE